MHHAWYDQRVRRVRDLPCGDLTEFAGITAYVQVMLVDPAAPRGISMTNALEIELVER